MNADEIVKRLREYAKHCDGVHSCWNDTTLISAADLIESLQAQLTEKTDPLEATIAGQETLQKALNRRAQPENEPPCYIAEKDNPYPLCVGRGIVACAHCCLWVDYDQDEDESHVNKPLTPDELASLEGEPIWIEQGANTHCKVLVKFINPVCYEARRFFFSDGTLLYLVHYNVGWHAYRRKPERSEG